MPPVFHPGVPPAPAPPLRSPHFRGSRWLASTHPLAAGLRGVPFRRAAPIRGPRWLVRLPLRKGGEPPGARVVTDPKGQFLSETDHRPVDG
jgi:hypothetical protein